MSRRPTNADSISLVIWMILIPFVAVFFVGKWLIAGVIALCALIVKLIRKRKVNKRYPGIRIEEVDRLDGIGFEEFCGNLLHNNGYKNIKKTKASGDYGVDIIAEKDGRTYVFQCKHYASNVGVHAVQEVYSGRKMYHADCAIVVTNSGFTPNAVAMANELGVGLWDRRCLIRMLDNTRVSRSEKVSQQKGVVNYPKANNVAAQSNRTYSNDISAPCASIDTIGAVKSQSATTKQQIPLEKITQFTVFEEIQTPQKEEKQVETKEEKGLATVLGAGRYTFGKNIPKGMYDLFVANGSGFLTIYTKDDEILITLGSDKAKEYRGIDSDFVKYFTLEGDVEVRIAKSKMIEIED